MNIKTELNKYNKNEIIEVLNEMMWMDRFKRELLLSLKDKKFNRLMQESKLITNEMCHLKIDSDMSFEKRAMVITQRIKLMDKDKKIQKEIDKIMTDYSSS